MVMLGTSDDPASTPAQSMRAESLDAGSVPRSLMGGLPVGTAVPPVWKYPGGVGTATPPTAGSIPHSSTPLITPAPPFLRIPERLVQAPGTFIMLVSHFK